MNARRNLKTLLVMAVILLGFGCTIAAGEVIYVDADASVGGNGQTWGTAYKYLQDALYKPPSGGDDIWVAEGTYKPGTLRTDTFQLISGVAIYGGFAGGETTLDERDWKTNETILSGDIGTGGVNGDNSYHVVTGSGINATAVLDGFTIIAGNANDVSWPHDGGGGMSNYPDSSPTVTNCTFSGNSAYADGGGMRNWSNSKPMVTNCTFSGNSSSQEGGGMMNGEASRPTVTNCTFSGNSAGEDGGGMYNNQTSNPMVTNCTFSGNSADFTGGGMYNVNSSSPTVTNCTFSGNSAGTHGGGMCNTDSNPMLTNCILWGDSAPTGPEIHNSGSTPIVTYSDIAGGYTGTGNIDEDPLFADADLRLSAGSPCIDAGDNSVVPVGVTTDLDGNPRFVDDPFTTDTGNGTAPIVDMGAYEHSVVGTAFTYQGHLYDGNRVADGLYDFKFKLYNNLSVGIQQGSTININELDVIDGYFTVKLDFGSDVFTGWVLNFDLDPSTTSTLRLLCPWLSLPIAC